MVGGLGVEVGDAAFAGVVVAQRSGDLLVTLTTKGQHQPDGRTGSASGGQAGADGVDARAHPGRSDRGFVSDAQGHP
ncbi:hypothetical protein [Actinomadura sp. NPDC048394]|uniref:hypothetical protein n=1 Tax=Actinomadura sp. NPDC048394 TaxID=3158223 RepID=UPI0033CE898C